MTKIAKKSKRPRIGAELIAPYSQWNNESFMLPEIQTRENISFSFSPVNYFRILKYQLEHQYKYRDTDSFIKRSFHMYARRVNILRLMRDVHYLSLEVGPALLIKNP